MSEQVPAPVITATPVEVKQIAANAPAPGTVEPTFPASHVHELREEAAGWRKKFREAEERIKTLEPLEKKVPELEGRVRGFQVDGALADAMAKAGVNPKLTKALIKDEISALDPNKDDFSKSLQSIVKKALDDNPELKLSAAGQQTATKMGSDITHPQTTTTVSTDQLTKADVARMKAAGDHDGIAKALKDGRLKAVMSGQG